MNKSLIILMLVSILGCNSQTADVADSDVNRIVIGGLYATKWDDGSFRIVKVLALDQHAAHLRLYAETFDEFPNNASSDQLTLGNALDGGPVGMGHFPIQIAGFFNEDRKFIKEEEVMESELKGYRLYLQSINQ